MGGSRIFELGGSEGARRCSDTFCGFLHKIYAATMDVKVDRAHIIFSHDDWGGGSLGAGHRAQGDSCPLPLPPRWRRPFTQQRH